jgi:transcriptional regulator with XRE-family HTH domain
MADHQRTIGQAVRDRREEMGLSQAQLAAKVGIKQSSLHAIENGSTLKSKFLPDIAKALEVHLEPLTMGILLGVNFSEPDQPGSRSVFRSNGAAQAAFSSGGSPQIPGDQLVGERDLPIYAATAGGDGHMIVTTDVIERVRRPANLEGVVGAYGILVVGDSLAKAYRHGDMALIHPGLQPLNDEVHVFYDHDPKTGEGESMIKNMLSYTTDKWRLEQFNPERKFTVDRVDWPIAHRVVGKYNRR